MGIPAKLIRLISALYSDARCSVLHRGILSEEFGVNSGVRQGCVLSPLLFITVLDDVLKEAAITSNGIWWNLTRKLGDLDFADDIALIANSHTQMQNMINSLNSIAQSRGLSININKTKLMRINTKNTYTIKIGPSEVENVTEYCYLGSMMSVNGGTSEDIGCRIAKARVSFGQLRNTWNTRCSIQYTSWFTIFQGHAA